MKNSFFLLLSSLLGLISIPTTAQLKVDSDGKVFVGFSSSFPYTGNLDIALGADSGDSCGISFKTNYEKHPFTICRKTGNTYIGYYLDNQFKGIIVNGSSAKFSGLMSHYLPNQTPISLTAPINACSYISPAIAATGSFNTDGIITSASFREKAYCYTAYSVDSFSHKTRTFFVQANGTVYAKNGFIQSSDISKKENIDSISSQKALNALTALHGVSFDYKKNPQTLSSPTEETAQSRIRALKDAHEGNREMDEELEKALREMEIIPETIRSQITKEQNRKRIGLIAQEVEAVVPEVVCTLPDGTKGIMYTDLIALIVEGMKEIQTTVQEEHSRIDSLEQTLHFFQSLVSFKTLNRSLDSESKEQRDGTLSSSLNKEVELYQNTPNPFSTSTTITYTIPGDLENGLIRIYNLNGEIVKQYPLSSHHGKITVQGNELESGTYIYVLIGGKQVLASHKMVKS